MTGTREKYLRLLDKTTSARSIDVGRGTIYLFQKYCKCCGAGMTKPNQWDRRELKKLWKNGFCETDCLRVGSRRFSTFSQTVKSQVPGHKNEHMVEELAFLRIQLDRESSKMTPTLKLVEFAKKNFRLLSEKLRFLELETKSKWGASKFFYWATKSYE